LLGSALQVDELRTPAFVGVSRSTCATSSSCSPLPFWCRSIGASGCGLPTWPWAAGIGGPLAARIAPSSPICARRPACVRLSVRFGSRASATCAPGACGDTIRGIGTRAPESKSSASSRRCAGGGAANSMTTWGDRCCVAPCADREQGGRPRAAPHPRRPHQDPEGSGGRRRKRPAT